jgi:hypothetical protein
MLAKWRLNDIVLVLKLIYIIKNINLNAYLNVFYRRFHNISPPPNDVGFSFLINKVSHVITYSDVSVGWIGYFK